MTWVRFLGYAAFSALGRVYQVVILDKILSWCGDLESKIQEFGICLWYRGVGWARYGEGLIQDALRVVVDPLTAVEPNEPGRLNTHINHGE
jgi:hypothetical protein